MAGARESLIPYRSGQQKSLAYISTAYTATAVVPPPSPHALTPRVISEMFIKIEVTRPEILLRNMGEPQAAISLNISMWNLGFVNCKSVLRRKNGIIATIEQRHIDTEVASAEPTTSISSPIRKKVRRPRVARLDATFMTMLVLTYPLIRR